MQKIITAVVVVAIVFALGATAFGLTSTHTVKAYHWKGCIGSACYEEDCDPNNEQCPPKIFGPG
jgi:hypothetical protein